MNATLKAIVSGIRTTTDGGYRITLDVSEDEIEAVKTMLSFKNNLVQIAAIRIELS